MLQLIKKYYDKVGRIVTVLKDKVTHEYTIQEQLFDRDGNSMLVDHNGCTVAMISYTFKDRKSCFDVLNRKYKRDSKK